MRSWNYFYYKYCELKLPLQKKKFNEPEFSAHNICVALKILQCLCLRQEIVLCVSWGLQFGTRVGPMQSFS